MTRSFPRNVRPWRGHKWFGRLVDCLAWRRGPSSSSCGSEADLSATHTAPEQSPNRASVVRNMCRKLSSRSTKDRDNNVVLLGIRSRTSETSLVPDKATRSSEYGDPFGELEMALYSEGLLEFRDSRASIPVLKIGYGFSDDELLALSKSTPGVKAEQYQQGSVEGERLWGDSSGLEPLIDGLPASVWMECVEPTLSILISLNSLRRRRSNLSIKKGVPQTTGTNRCRHGDFEFGPIAIFRHPGHIQQMMLLRVEFLNAAANAAAGNNPNNNINQSAEHNNRRGYNRHRRFRHTPLDEITLGNISHLSNYLNESTRLGAGSEGNNNNSNNNNSSSSSCSRKINNSNMNVMPFNTLKGCLVVSYQNWDETDTYVSDTSKEEQNVQNQESAEDAAWVLYNLEPAKKLLPRSERCTKHTKHNPIPFLNWNCNAGPIPEIAESLLDRSEPATPPPLERHHNSEDVDIQEHCQQPNKTAAAMLKSCKDCKTHKKLAEPQMLGQFSADWKGKLRTVVTVLNHPSVARHGYQRQMSVHEDEDLNNCARPDNTVRASSSDELKVQNTKGLDTSQRLDQSPPAGLTCSPTPMVGAGADSPADVLGSLVIASAAVMLGTTMSAPVPPDPSAASRPEADLKHPPDLCTLPGGDGSSGQREEIEEAEEEEVHEDGGDNVLKALLPAPSIRVNITHQPTTHPVPCPLSSTTVATTSATTPTTTTQPVDVLALGDNALWSFLPSERVCYLPARFRGTVIRPGGTDASRPPRSAKRHLLNYPRRLVRRARGAWYRWRMRMEHAKISRDQHRRLE